MAHRMRNWQIALHHYHHYTQQNLLNIDFKATLDAVDISGREVQLWRDRLHVSGFRAVMPPLDGVYTVVAVVVSAARLQ